MKYPITNRRYCNIDTQCTCSCNRSVLSSSSLSRMLLYLVSVLLIVLPWNSLSVVSGSSNNNNQLNHRSFLIILCAAGVTATVGSAPTSSTKKTDPLQQQYYDTTTMNSINLNPTSQYNIDESYIRVTIRHIIVASTTTTTDTTSSGINTAVPSCQPHITQIEIQNLHSKQDLVIHSMELSNEMTRLLQRKNEHHNDDDTTRQHYYGKSQSPELHIPYDDDDDNNNNNNHDTSMNMMDDIPQQLYLSKLPNGGILHIGPGQVGVIPITFLPQFPAMINITTTTTTRTIPDNTSDHCNCPQSIDVWDDTVLSPYQQADWEDCNESIRLTRRRGDSYYHNRRQRRNNSLQQQTKSMLRAIYEQELFAVTATVNIDTNRGNYNIPYEVTSIRHNSFGLPDIIYFDVPDDTDIDFNHDESGSETHFKPTSHPSQWHWSDVDDERMRSLKVQSNEHRLSDIGEQSMQKDTYNDLRIKETMDLFRSLKTKENGAIVGNYQNEAVDCNDIDSCSTNNISGIDDNLHFENDRLDRIKSIDTTDENISVIHNVRIVDRIRQQFNDEDHNDSSTEETNFFDCHDLYMRNPDPNVLLKVSEVLLSKSKYVTLLILPDKHNDNSTRLMHLSYHQRITDWSNRSKSVFGRSDGSLTIPGDNNSHYVVTLCLKYPIISPPGIHPFAESIIHNNSTNIYDDPINSKNRNDKFLAGLPDWIDFGSSGKSLGLLQIKSSQGTMFLSLMKAGETLRRNLKLFDAHGTNNIVNDQTCKPCRNKSSISENIENSTIFLMTSPSSIDFSLVSTSVPKYEISIDLTNVSPSPITVMRIAVILDEQMIQDNVNITSRVGTTETRTVQTKGIELKMTHISDAAFKSISPGSTVKQATTLHCSVDWSELLQFDSTRLSFTIKGAIVLRGKVGSSTSYINWITSVSRQNSNPSNFVVEIPLTITIAHGTVGFLLESSTLFSPSLWSMTIFSDKLDVVSSTFFPYYPSHTAVVLPREEKENYLSGFKGPDHQFRIFNDVFLDVAVNDVIIRESNVSQSNPSVCDRLSAYIVERGPGDHIDLDDYRNMGSVVVRYRYRTLSSDSFELELSNNGIYPVICNLRIVTDPPSGLHELPLIVYFGKLAVSKDRDAIVDGDESLNTTLDDSKGWYHVTAGLDNVLQWFQSTKAGFSIRSMLWPSTNRNNDMEHYSVLLKRYLYRLAETPENPDVNILKPVLLNIGGIEQGLSITVPLYITNYNPVPVSITTVVGSVEGQSISLGRVVGSENDAVKHLFQKLSSHKQNEGEPRAYTGRFRGHPINGLRHMLMSNEIPQKYFERFGYRDDITLSNLAISKFSFLKQIYQKFATINLRENPFPRWFTPSESDLCDNSMHPSIYGEFEKKSFRPREELTGPIIISSDRKSFRRLRICWDKDIEPDIVKSDGNVVIVPPGGVARFDVNVRAPFRNNLLKDITQFVTTGLVLSTDHGEIIPIIITFKALLGNLELAQAQQTDRREIAVPVDLFRSLIDQGPTLLQIPPHNVHSIADLGMDKMIVTRTVRPGNKGISLYAKSSFSRDVRLRRIDSCSPWFNVNLANETVDSDPYLGLNIGFIHSAIACRPIEGLPIRNSSFPSFFRCALEFLTRQDEFLTQFCGLSLSQNPATYTNNTDAIFVRKNFEQLVASVRHALLVSEWSDEYVFGDTSGIVPRQYNLNYPIKSGRKNVDGTISESVIESVSNALELLKSASKEGLLSFGTRLRAVVDYNATPDEISPIRRGATEFVESNHRLSLTIDKTALKSDLITPKLLNREKIAGSFALDNDSQRMVFNATIFGQMTSITIPLRNPTSVPVRVRLGVERRRSEAYFNPPYVQKIQPMEDSPISWANEQWWDLGGAYFQADFNGNVIRSPYNVSVKSGLGAFISTMNPSVSSNIAFLNGCGHRCGIVEKDYGLPLPVVVADVSPIGAAAAAGRMLAGNALYMRQIKSDKFVEWQRFADSAGASFVTGGQGPSAFAIPHSALDEVIIPPFGEADLGPIYFRPTGRTTALGCDAIMTKKRSNSCESQKFMATVFIENSLTGIEEVTLEGKAHWEKISFRSPDLLDGFDDIELRHGYPTLVFAPPSGTSKAAKLHASIKEFAICNQGDTTVKIVNGFLSAHWSAGDVLNRPSCRLNGFRVFGCDDTNGIESFTLLPGQNRSFFVEHLPTNSKPKSHVMLHFELDLWDKSPYQSGAIGYNFESSERRSQRIKNTFRRKVSLSIIYASQATNMMRSGLYRETMVDHDKDYNRLIDISSMSSEYSASSNVQDQLSKILYFISFFGVVAAWIVLLGRQVKWLRNYTFTFYSKLIGTAGSNEGQYWRAMFRCIARINPSSFELINIGRDQTRYILFARMKQMGAMQPQFFNYLGLPKRERSGTSGSGGRHVVNSSTVNRSNRSSVNERVRVSDAIFEKVDPSISSGRNKGVVPLQLGWRCAMTRGIIDSSTLQTSPIALTTLDLLYRRTQPIPTRIEAITGIKSFNGDNSSATSGLDSSIGDLSDEESLSAPTVPKIVSYDPSSVSLELKESTSQKVSQPVTEPLSAEKSGEEKSMSGNDSLGCDKILDSEKTIVDSHEKRGDVPSNNTTVINSPQDAIDLPTTLTSDDRHKVQSIVALEKSSANGKNPDKIHPTSQLVVKNSTSASKSRPVKKNKPKGASPSNAATTLSTKETSPKTAPNPGRKVMEGDTNNPIKNQRPTGRAKDRIERKAGRKKVDTCLETPPLVKGVVPSVSATTRRPENTGTRPSGLRPPPGLSPPPGFNDTQSSSDCLQHDAKHGKNNKESSANWNAKSNSNPHDNEKDNMFQLPTHSSSESPHFIQNTPEPTLYMSQQTLPQYTPSHSSPQRPQLISQNNIDPLLGLHTSIGVTSNNNYVSADSPSFNLDNMVLNTGISENAEATYDSVTTPMHHSTVPGLRTLVPPITLGSDDRSNTSGNQYNQHYNSGVGSSMMDFDVMDFLDHILEEGSGHASSNGMDLFDSNPVSTSNSNGGMMLNNIIPAASINPWSMDTSENSSMNNNDNNTYLHQNPSSRAAAYGIAFDSAIGNSRTTTVTSSPYDAFYPSVDGNDDIPLLTPLAISATPSLLNYPTNNQHQQSNNNKRNDPNETNNYDGNNNNNQF